MRGNQEKRKKIQIKSIATTSHASCQNRQSTANHAVIQAVPVLEGLMTRVVCVNVWEGGKRKNKFCGRRSDLTAGARVKRRPDIR